MKFFGSFCRTLKDLLFPDPEAQWQEYWAPDNVLEMARRDWLAAQSMFEEATGPELTELAIYNLKAAEAKYSYLLTRQRTISNSPQLSELKNSRHGTLLV